MPTHKLECDEFIEKNVTKSENLDFSSNLFPSSEKF
jgi:hypothetical protein